MVRLYHISDIHIRLRSRFQEYRAVMEWMDRWMEDQPRGIIVVTGDIFHSKAELTPDCIVLLLEWVERWVSKMPTVMIMGNHDALLHNKDRSDSLSAVFRNRHISGFHYWRDSGVYDVEGITFFVYSLWDPEAHPSLTELHRARRQEDPEMISVALYHGGVGEFRIASGIRMKGEMAVEDWDGFTAVLLGDIHLHQHLTERVAYAGSLVSQNFGECDADHGILVWEIEGVKQIPRTMLVRVPNEYAYAEVTWHDHTVTCSLLPGVKIPMAQVWDDVSVLPLPSKGHVRCVFTATVSSTLQKKWIQRLTRVFPNIQWLVRVMERRETHDGLVSLPPSREMSSLLPFFSMGAEDGSTSSSSFFPPQSMVEAEETFLTEWVHRFLRPLGTSVAETERIRDTLCQWNRERRVGAIGNRSWMHHSWKMVYLEVHHLFGYGHLVVDWTTMQTHEIIGIFGKNSSGKSTWIDLFCMALFGKTTRSFHGNTIPKEVIHLKSDKASLLFRLEHSGHRYEIAKQFQRDTKSGRMKVKEQYFEIDTEGKRIQNQTAEDRKKTDAHIASIVGTMQDFLFLHSSLQHSVMEKSFAKMTQKERKDLLFRHLGFQWFEDKYEECHTKARTLKAECTLLETQSFRPEFVSMQEEYNDLQSKVSTLPPLPEANSSFLSPPVPCSRYQWNGSSVQIAERWKKKLEELKGRWKEEDLCVPHEAQAFDPLRLAQLHTQWDNLQKEWGSLVKDQQTSTISLESPPVLPRSLDDIPLLARQDEDSCQRMERWIQAVVHQKYRDAHRIATEWLQEMDQWVEIFDRMECAYPHVRKEIRRYEEIRGMWKEEHWDDLDTVDLSLHRPISSVSDRSLLRQSQKKRHEEIQQYRRELTQQEKELGEIRGIHLSKYKSLMEAVWACRQKVVAHYHQWKVHRSAYEALPPCLEEVTWNLQCNECRNNPYRSQHETLLHDRREAKQRLQESRQTLQELGRGEVMGVWSESIIAPRITKEMKDEEAGRSCRSGGGGKKGTSDPPLSFSPSFSLVQGKQRIKETKGGEEEDPSFLVSWVEQFAQEIQDYYQCLVKYEGTLRDTLQKSQEASRKVSSQWQGLRSRELRLEWEEIHQEEQSDGQWIAYRKYQIAQQMRWKIREWIENSKQWIHKEETSARHQQQSQSLLEKITSCQEELQRYGALQELDRRREQGQKEKQEWEEEWQRWQEYTEACRTYEQEQLRRESERVKRQSLEQRIAVLRVSLEQRDALQGQWEQKKKEWRYWECLEKMVHRDGLPSSLLIFCLPRMENQMNHLLQTFLRPHQRIRLEMIDGTISLEMAYRLSTKEKEIEDRPPSDTKEGGLVPEGHSTFFGGMEMFMIDITFKTVLRNIGCQPRAPLFFLDEGISVLDQDRIQDIERLFDFLRSEYPFVLVISHIPLIQDLVRYQWMMECDPIEMTRSLTVISGDST